MSPLRFDEDVVGYPDGWDVEWVAVDRHGHVGVFTTAGGGPVPRAYLAPLSLLEHMSEALWAMSERTECVLLISVPRPDDFVAMARRGFFAFDWTGGYNTSRPSDRYELAARPVTPVAFDADAWPADLRPILLALRHPSLDFSQLIVDVSALDCEDAPS